MLFGHKYVFMYLLNKYLNEHKNWNITGQMYGA